MNPFRSVHADCGFLWLWIFLIQFGGICGAFANPARVLILNPYGRDVEPFGAVVSAFRTTLARELGEPVDFHEIPLDLGRFEGLGDEEPLVAFLEDLIRAYPVDLVVPVGFTGAQFADRHRGRLFPTVPALVVTGDPRMIPARFLETNATMITEAPNLAGMVEDILRIRPGTTHIAVVFGASPLEDFWVNECRREFQPFMDRVEFTWLNGLPLSEVVEQCRKLPPDSFILHGFFLEDASGVDSEKSEAIRLLHESANAPLFGYFESELGLGIVGGRLFQNTRIGELGAGTAVRILRGENPETIPVRTLETAVPRYDWRELSRWGIGEAVLPPGSVVEFREPNFWGRYRWQISGAISLVVLQSFFIFGLLVNRSRRRRGEAEATLVAEISSNFVHLPATEVDREILNAQKRLCEFFGIDQAALWQWEDREGGYFTATHLYSLKDGPQSPVRMKEEDFPWVLQEVLAGRVVSHRSLDDMPPEAAKDREMASQFGIKSHLTIPLLVGKGRPLGILGFNSARSERSWPKAMVNRMQLIAEIFANALSRKRAEQSLRESDFRLGMAADAADAGLWELDLESQTFLVNDQARKIFGYSVREPIDMATFRASVLPDDWDAVVECIRRAVENSDPLSVEYRIRVGDDVKWVASKGRTFFDRTGSPERLVGLSVDITGRRRSEERLRQLSPVVEQSPVLVVITDPHGRIDYVNRKFTEVSGYAPEECIGRNPSMLKSGESPPEFYRELWTSITGGNTWRGEFHNRKKNGELYWERAIVSPLIDAEGQITHYVGIKEDVTAEKQSHAALVASERLNWLTFEQAVIGISHASPDWRLLSVNEKFCAIAGYPRDELLKLSSREITHPDDLPKQLSLTDRLLSGEIEAFSLEKRYLRKDGSVAWVTHNAFLLRTPSGEPWQFVSLVGDITEQRLAEAEVRELRDHLAHAGRVTLMGQLATGLAHELSQPLGAILRNAEAADLMLRADSPDWEEIRDIVTDILRDNHRAGRVIDRLRSLLKRRLVESLPLNLPEVIDEVLSLIHADAVARHVNISLRAEPDLPMALGDRTHLQQVLLNLLVNAMEALEDCAADRRHIRIEARQADSGFVEVRVADSGPGIPADSFDRLFELFLTSKSNGMGVGLPVSRTIIESHHGRLWAENSLEGGACFCFTLPITGAGN